MDDPGGRERTRGRAFFHLEHVTGQPAHVHGFHATIKLVVGRDGQAVLLTHDRGRHPADRYGWFRLVNDLGPEFSGERG